MQASRCEHERRPVVPRQRAAQGGVGSRGEARDIDGVVDHLDLAARKSQVAPQRLGDVVRHRDVPADSAADRAELHEARGAERSVDVELHCRHHGRNPGEHRRGERELARKLPREVGVEHVGPLAPQQSCECGHLLQATDPERKGRDREELGAGLGGTPLERLDRLRRVVDESRPPPVAIEVLEEQEQCGLRSPERGRIGEQEQRARRAHPPCPSRRCSSPGRLLVALFQPLRVRLGAVPARGVGTGASPKLRPGGRVREQPGDGRRRFVGVVGDEERSRRRELDSLRPPRRRHDRLPGCECLQHFHAHPAARPDRRDDDCRPRKLVLDSRCVGSQLDVSGRERANLRRHGRAHDEKLRPAAARTERRHQPLCEPARGVDVRRMREVAGEEDRSGFLGARIERLGERDPERVDSDSLEELRSKRPDPVAIAHAEHLDDVGARPDAPLVRWPAPPVELREGPARPGGRRRRRTGRPASSPHLVLGQHSREPGRNGVAPRRVVLERRHVEVALGGEPVERLLHPRDGEPDSAPGRASAQPASRQRSPAAPAAVRAGRADRDVEIDAVATQPLECLRLPGLPRRGGHERYVMAAGEEAGQLGMQHERDRSVGVRLRRHRRNEQNPHPLLRSQRARWSRPSSPLNPRRRLG